MNKSQKQIMTSKWALVVDNYERIENKNNSSIKTVNELCEAFQAGRKDIRIFCEMGKSGRSFGGGKGQDY